MPWRRVACGAWAILAAASLALGQESRAGATDPDARHIFWQRSLDDALILAKIEKRPLFIAVNMDGESASDRIVHELYRDPGFVAATRRCVCLVGSVFRHNPRDYDDAGRRIPCPRLGEVTCGEHIALEPILHDRFLADGERVAPRHALVLPGGTKAWDLSLSFDLRDIEKELVRSLAGSADPTSRTAESGPAAAPDWNALATRRDQRGRAALEALLVGPAGIPPLPSVLAALAAHGDRGSLPTLRLVATRLADADATVQPALIETARALGLEAGLAAILRDQVGAIGPRDERRRAAALAALSAFDSASEQTSRLLHACRALETVSLESSLRAAAESRDLPLPRANPITDSMPAAPELETELAKLVESARDPGADASLFARVAKVSLDLGRRRIEAGQAEAVSLVRDAETWFRRALEARPHAVEWWIERARAAYFLHHPLDEAAFGRRAFELRTVQATDTASILDDGVAIEALRWIGDGDVNALIAGTVDGPDPTRAAIVEALRALSIVAASPFADGSDWIAWASFLGWLGLPGEELAILRAAALRLPAAIDVRAALNTTLWNAGRIDLAPEEAERILERHPSSADALWFAGQAWTLAAENHRRRESAELALHAYERARSRFAAAAAARPDYGDDCRLRGALAWFGSGMACLLATGREAAADALVEGVKTWPKAATVRDGLDSDVLDLIDRIFEWRETSGPSYVDPVRLLDRLEAADPGNAFWALAISDAELREALRADGRNPERTERDTVDASGKKIRMMLGLPTAEGDRYLSASILAARRAMMLDRSESTRRALAQPLTMQAERLLLRDRADEARGSLAEAAGLLRVNTLGRDGPEACPRVAAELRALLGDARPRLRQGR